MNEYELFILARWAYGVGPQILSDVEYSKLELKMKAERPNDPYCNRTWSSDPCPKELLRKYNMGHLIKDIKLSGNSESIPAITTWSDLHDMFCTLNEKSRLSFKIDGWHLKANYYNGSFISGNTRGRTGDDKEALVISEIVPKTIPFSGRATISGEGSIPNDKWDLFSLTYGGVAQRQSVSTVIAKGDSRFLSFLSFAIDADDPVEGDVDRYMLLRNMGFKTPYSLFVSNYNELVKGIAIMSERQKVYNYLTDGLVIENEHTQYAIRLGAWEEEVLKSYVVGYEERPGMYGVSEVIKIKPVVVRDATRSSINLTNVQQLINNNLKIGYPIAFNIRSSAVASIDSENTRQLQNQWQGRYDKYREFIDKGEN